MTKEALILVLELAEQAALDPDTQSDDNLREIADAQREALSRVYGLLDSIDWKCWE